MACWNRCKAEPTTPLATITESRNYMFILLDSVLQEYGQDRLRATFLSHFSYHFCLLWRLLRTFRPVFYAGLPFSLRWFLESTAGGVWARVLLGGIILAVVSDLFDPDQMLSGFCIGFQSHHHIFKSTKQKCRRNLKVPQSKFACIHERVDTPMKRQNCDFFTANKCSLTS